MSEVLFCIQKAFRCAHPSPGSVLSISGKRREISAKQAEGSALVSQLCTASTRLGDGNWQHGETCIAQVSPFSCPTIPGRAVCPHCRFPICWWVLLGCQKALSGHNACCLLSDFLWPSALSSCSLRCSWRSPSAHLNLIKFEDMFKQQMHLLRSPQRGFNPNQEPGMALYWCVGLLPPSTSRAMMWQCCSLISLPLSAPLWKHLLHS